MRFYIFLVAAAMVFIMSSCTAVSGNAGDEIRLNRWKTELKGGEKVSLSFKDDNASFKILSNNNKLKLKISGLCLIDSKRIMICDSVDKENYVFDYVLKDNGLSLFYSSGKLKLLRENNRN